MLFGAFFVPQNDWASSLRESDFFATRRSVLMDMAATEITLDLG